MFECACLFETISCMRCVIQFLCAAVCGVHTQTHKMRPTDRLNVFVVRMETITMSTHFFRSLIVIHFRSMNMFINCFRRNSTRFLCLSRHFVLLFERIFLVLNGKQLSKKAHERAPKNFNEFGLIRIFLFTLTRAPNSGVSGTGTTNENTQSFTTDPGDSMLTWRHNLCIFNNSSISISDNSDKSEPR